MLDRVTGMQVFARAAALGSLAAAARALGMSQTMATKHLAALEARLGVTLVHRTTRRLSLTEPGRRYLERATRILLEIEEADAAAILDRQEVRGTLRVNAPSSFGVRELAPALPAFAARHPGLTVDIGFNDRVIDLAEEGWDVAVRVGRLPDLSLVARKLATCRMVLAAAPAYLARRGTPSRTGDLALHNCLAYTLSDALGPVRWHFGTDGRHGVPIAGNLRAGNGDALVAAALGGQGIIYQPAFLLGRELKEGRLVELILDEPPVEPLGVFALYHGDRHPPAKVRAFIDSLIALFRPVPPWERHAAEDA